MIFAMSDKTVVEEFGGATKCQEDLASKKFWYPTETIDQ
jgi:hypothetical protein